MIDTPADPGAIEFKTIEIALAFAQSVIKSGEAWTNTCEKTFGSAFAAVEALREDLAGYETVFNLAQKRERPWIEAWRKATGKPDTLPDYGEMLGWLCGQIEAAEARVVELEKTYGQAVDKFDACRAALARRVEQDTGKLPHPPDSNTQEWHEWLIEQSDMGIEASEAREAGLAGALDKSKELKTVCRNVINSKEAQQALGIGSITALKNALDALGKEEKQ